MLKVGVLMFKLVTTSLILALVTTFMSQHKIHAQTPDQFDYWITHSIQESGFEIEGCEANNANNGITFCRTSSSTLPGGYILADINQGLICVLNIRSIPIWGKSAYIFSDREVFSKCDELLSAFDLSDELNDRPVVDLSVLPGFIYNELSLLPVGNPDVQNGGCLSIDDSFRTVAGETLAENDWVVLSEITISKYSLISFTETMHRYTSSICDVEGGKIAIFENENLIGLISTENPSSNWISYLEYHEGGRVRIFDGSYEKVPVADLVVTPDAITLEPVPNYTSFCSGRELVPNVYGLDIRDAREQLFQAGWVPASPEEEVEPRFLPSSLIENGVSEALGCGGTGLNYCGFKYQHLGAQLNVTSVGEIEYLVADFEVICPD